MYLSQFVLKINFSSTHSSLRLFLKKFSCFFKINFISGYKSWTFIDKKVLIFLINYNMKNKEVIIHQLSINNKKEVKTTDPSLRKHFSKT